ncbi:uncharacterized protein LOC123452898 [Hordeum vulgare subsp. vulgare]|uniref:uncharacterized protein LOC123452898 n=1 Tax=Hordeum vulgare subsp. vulgare TaxID=112509 RepID=UPI001D1A5B15|nr:uncharacterized protein LOC123452898 [Hordeum vulgare subsp. vulgare]
MTSPPRPGAASLSVGTLSRIRVGGSASSIRVSVPHSDTFPPISPPARSPSPGTPATEQGDGSGGEGKQSTRAEVGRVAAIAVGPSPSPGSTVSSSHDDDGRDQETPGDIWCWMAKLDVHGGNITGFHAGLKTVEETTGNHNNAVEVELF